MKRFTFLFILLQINIFSLNYMVEEKEIRTDKKIEFINYEGKRTRVDKTKDVIGIGERLAGIEGRLKTVGKYSVLHIVSNKGDKFDADIFIIEKDAEVDHIKNVRAMIAGYLSKSYNYKYDDAYTIATFLTYYNAVYRGNIDYFTSKYKDEVIKNISKNNAGIDISYKNWAGKTRMLIPIVSYVEEKKISLSETTEKKVIDRLKEEKDKGTGEREKITKIKEKELKEIKEEVKKKEQDLEKEKAKLEEDKTKKETLIKEIKDLKEKGSDENAKKEIVKKEEEVKKIDKDIKEKEEKIKEKEKKVEEGKNIIKQKEEEIKKDKEEIKKDKEEVKKIEEIKKNPEEALKKIEKLEKEVEEKKALVDKNIYKDRFYYLKRLKFTTGGFYDSQMIAIDAAVRKIITRSPLNIITGQDFSITDDGIIVIARKTEKSDEHLLTMLDKDELKPIRVSKTEVFVRSFIRVDEGFIYCIVKENNKFYLGKFDKDLILVKKTDREIDQDSIISVYKDMIYINSSDKNIFVFDKNKLEFVDQIKP